MKQYKIVTASDPERLSAEITDMMDKGWQSAGGVSVAYQHMHSDHGHVPGHLVYAQAMVKG
jgi:hypothetical protein